MCALQLSVVHQLNLEQNVTKLKTKRRVRELLTSHETFRIVSGKERNEKIQSEHMEESILGNRKFLRAKGEQDEEPHKTML